MKAMVLVGRRAIEMQEVADPAIKNENDVLLRVTTIGVCGSDVHYYTSGKIGSQIVQYPFTVGHECAGIVEGTGPAVTKVKVGDKVAIEPAISCGICDQCKSGRSNTCRNLRFLGCPGQAEGCLSEKIVMPEENCFPLRDGLTLVQGALSEPLAIGVYAVKRSIPLRGAKIGVLGCGPIGLSVILPALAQGASAIYASDKIDARLLMAKKAGATWTGNPLRQEVVREISEIEPKLLDVIFECCGQQEALDQAVELVKPGGKIMIIGIPPTLEKWTISVEKTRRKEICVQNVRRQAHCVQAALDIYGRKTA